MLTATAPRAAPCTPHEPEPATCRDFPLFPHARVPGSTGVFVTQGRGSGLSPGRQRGPPGQEGKDQKGSPSFRGCRLQLCVCFLPIQVQGGGACSPALSLPKHPWDLGGVGSRISSPVSEPFQAGLPRRNSLISRSKSLLLSSPGSSACQGISRVRFWVSPGFLVLL